MTTLLLLAMLAHPVNDRPGGGGTFSGLLDVDLDLDGNKIIDTSGTNGSLEYTGNGQFKLCQNNGTTCTQLVVPAISGFLQIRNADASGYGQIQTGGFSAKEGGFVAIEDNVQARFGTSIDYRMVYDSTAFAWEFETTDIDGVGNDGNFMIVKDGAPEVFFTGTIKTEVATGAAPAEPHACDAEHAGVIVAVDDTDNTAYDEPCICLNLDGTGYDWRQLNNVTATACPYF